MSKGRPPFSLGTFGEGEARAIASRLVATEGIRATVENLRTPFKDEPTVWWHVYVPSGVRVQASTWLRGYRAACEVRR